MGAMILFFTGLFRDRWPRRRLPRTSTTIRFGNDNKRTYA